MGTNQQIEEPEPVLKKIFQVIRERNLKDKPVIRKLSLRTLETTSNSCPKAEINNKKHFSKIQIDGASNLAKEFSEKLSNEVRNTNGQTVLKSNQSQLNGLP